MEISPAQRRNNSQGTDSVGNGDLGANSGGTDSVRTKRAKVAAVETRGRHKRSRTQLRNLYEDGKQFKYRDYTRGDYKYTTQLGCILKRQYHGALTDGNGELYPATTWADYYEKTNDQGETCAHKRLFTVADEHKREAARVLENYCKKRVWNIMYQVRVDAVKLHYENQGEILDDTLACRRELNENEYPNARVEWCKEDVWPLLAAYWDSDEFKEKRSKAHDSRLSNEDLAWCLQEVVHGPEKATILNTYAVMKSGAKNMNNNGSSGVIPSQKAQKRMRDYQEGVEAAHPDDPEQTEVDGLVLYTKGGGLPHGRLLIGDGTVRKVNVIAAAKGKKSRPSTSDSYQHLSEENHQLRRANEGLTQHNVHLTQQQEVDHELIMGAPGSSHAGSQSIHNDGMDGAGTSTNGNNNVVNVEINDTTTIGLGNNRGDILAEENGSDDDSEALYANSDIDAGHDNDACAGREADRDAS
ncbi:hypothetical protein BRADI_2g15805v3 [Brachypodium distachyon]|uniref:Uncharacterized protein n=1 Tax=Brachypodium distachyon TaxID=15368 RepID=A0A0Q3IFS4_BRADI|nr:hypothetical protein BRADI_2g15805v3 [Brachypodium distachyon]